MIRTRTQGIALLVVGTLTLGGAAVAHHSRAATYFLDRTVTIQGKIVMFTYRNPHAILQVMAPGNDGQSYRWACEWGDTLMLDNSGINSNTLKPGDKVVVTGLPARNPEDHRLFIKSIQRLVDGWKWSGDAK